MLGREVKSIKVLDLLMLFLLYMSGGGSVHRGGLGVGPCTILKVGYC